MRVSQYFSLGKTQPFLDFVDIRLDTDIPVFVDPGAIKSLKSPWGQECASLVQRYFKLVLNRIKEGEHQQAQRLVSCLNERNEFHLGYSKKRSRGHAFGEISAQAVWGALSKSKAATSGLLRDLEDTCLLIEGIGRDMISDALCNIIRAPLMRYTQDMCEYYGIPLTPNVHSGPLWNPASGEWELAFVSLPTTPEGKFILVPKILVRYATSYNFHNYYTHYLLPEMKSDEIRARSELVELLKNGTPRVTKKALRKKYGSNKLAVVEQTLRRPGVLKRFKHDHDRDPPAPLQHVDFAEIEGTKPPQWDSLIGELRILPTGRDHAAQYETLIERILTALFYPSLCNPTKQDQIHNGRKRVDITYTNEARNGFFYWLSMHYPSGFIFVECKNYGKEVGNPEVDQLSGRFSPSRGQVGILVCRSISDREKIAQTCLDTANDHRGFVVVLDDSDVEDLVDEAVSAPDQCSYSSIRQKFVALIK